MNSRIHLIAVIVVAVLAGSLVPAVASSPAAAQEQTSWHVNDDPVLFGPGRYWWAGDAGKGYGSNNYRFTLAIGGESESDNWAHWYMGDRVGRQEVQVYVPHTKATATVTYQVIIDGRTYRRQLAQRSADGWTSLGNYDADGGDVTIVIADNDAVQHWERDGYDASRIGVDAARMRCVARCSTAPPPPTTTTTQPPPPPRVDPPSAPEILGAVVDVRSIGVAWSPPADDGGAPVTGYVVELYEGGRRVRRSSHGANAREDTFHGLDPSTRYEFRVYARNSAGTGPAAIRSTATHDHDDDMTAPPTTTQPPGAPTNLRTDTDSDSVSIAWSPPTDDGGAPVTGYRVELYRGGFRLHDISLSSGSRSLLSIGGFGGIGGGG